MCNGSMMKIMVHVSAFFKENAVCIFVLTYTSHVHGHGMPIIAWNDCKTWPKAESRLFAYSEDCV